jgi:F420-dependent oxidoreductase-like protein
MQVCLMIEGQEGVTWDQWVALARTCEEHGLDGLFRSDHYVSIWEPGRRGALEAWATIAALGALTSRIRLGVLVSPVTFRHPSMLARAVITADHTSGGRVELGIGAGWYEQEHTEYGFPYPDTATRMEMLTEQLEVIQGQWGPEPFDFEGHHYRVDGLRAHPAPVQRPHPPIILGGRARRRSADLAARYADEYNTVAATLEECRDRRERLARACEQAGRDPATLRFSLMTRCVVGHDRDDLIRTLRRTGEDDPDDVSRSNPGWIVGTVDEVVSRLRDLEDAGVERVMLQNLVHEDLDMVGLVGDEVAPQVR